MTFAIISKNTHRLTETLNALNTQSKPDFEVIIIHPDQNQMSIDWQDYHFDICRIDVKWDLGLAFAKNTALKYVRTEIVAFLEQGAVPQADVAEKILNHFQNKLLRGLRGKFVPLNPDDDLPQEYDLGEAIIPTDCAAGVLTAFRKAAIEKVGGFDEWLTENVELIDLSFRIAQNSTQKIHSILYCPDVVVCCQTNKTDDMLAMIRRKCTGILARGKNPAIDGYAEYMQYHGPDKKHEIENDYVIANRIAQFMLAMYPEKAVEWAKKAVALQPGIAECHYNLGCIYAALKDYHSAQQIFEQLLESLQQLMTYQSDDAETIQWYGKTAIKLLEVYCGQDNRAQAKLLARQILDHPHIQQDPDQKQQFLELMEQFNSPAINRQTATTDLPVEQTVTDDPIPVDLSIILATKDRAELLDEMLTSLQDAANGIDYEVIVIEGGSSDKTMEILQKQNVTKVFDETEHLGVGRHSWPQLYNFGLEKARGKWAMFASDDITFSPNCLSDAVARLDSCPPSVAGGILFYKNSHPTNPQWADFAIDFAHGQKLQLNYGLIRMDDFNAAGGLTEDYRFYCADTDLCYKLYEQGKTLIPLPRGFVTHHNLLDTQKSANADTSGRDIQLLHTRWQHYISSDLPHPRRLFWQPEMADAFGLPADMKQAQCNWDSFWHGLALLQSQNSEPAMLKFIECFKAGCQYPVLLKYLARAAQHCGRSQLVEKIHAVIQKPLSSGNTDHDDDSKPQIAALIFSKDRAMQLHAALQSFIQHCRDNDKMTISILYKTSNQKYQRQYEQLQRQFPEINFIPETNFKRQTLSILRPHDMILFIVDDNICVRDFSIEQIARTLIQTTDALGFSLRLGMNTTYCYAKDADQPLPSFENVTEHILKYNWTGASFDFAYPLELSSSLYRCADILPMLERLDFDNPNIAEGLLAANARIFADTKSMLLCFDTSVAFCNPVNIVQSVSDNRSGSNQKFTSENLAKLFDDGYRVDTADDDGFTPQACHQEVPLRFKKIRTKPVRTKGHTPLVTVEMVTYNGEKYIAKAIESVLSQTFGDFELLIVDDGSTDNTADMIQSFKDARVNYIHQSHANCATARNTVIRNASGTYILTVDCDDTLSPQYLENMLAVARRSPGIDYFYPAALALIDETDRQIGQWDYREFEDNKALVHFLFDQGFSPIPNPGSLKRKALFDKTGPYDNLDSTEDFVFLCQNALKLNFKRCAIQSPYFYRRLAESLSTSSDARDRITAETLHWMIQHYRPEMLCPDIRQIEQNDLRKLHFYRYIIKTLSKHAQGYHMIKNSHYFEQYITYYRLQLTQLEKDLQMAVRPEG